MTAVYDRTELARLPKEDIIDLAVTANKKTRTWAQAAKDAASARKDTVIRMTSGVLGGVAVGAVKGHVEATVYNELGNESAWTEEQEKEATAMRNLFGFLPKHVIAPGAAGAVALMRPKGIKEWQLNVAETFAIGGLSKILGDYAEEIMLDRADVKREISYAEDLDDEE